MNKKTIIIMNVVVIVMWLATIIINLLSEDISKFSYGVCGFTLILSWIFKTVSDVRICELYDQNSKLFEKYYKLLSEHLKTIRNIIMKEEEQ